MEDANLQERTQLIDDLKFKVGRCNRRPLNIVFIGTPGCGKSSFINSFAAAIADKCWQEFAFSGGGGRLLGDNQTTVRMQCIASENYVTSSNLKDWSLPTLIDLTGFQDEDEEITSDLLRLIFYGKLKNSTNIHKVFRFGRRFGVEALRWRYGVFSTECHFKVDRVVFIASATRGEVPAKLIKCVMKAARPTTDFQNREIPVFGVLTEYDLVVESQTEEYKERKRRFQELLALGGASHRFLECANYCDDVDPAMTRTRQILPQIDIPILKFMNVVCGQNYVVTNSEESYHDVKFSHLKEQIFSTIVSRRHRVPDVPPPSVDSTTRPLLQATSSNPDMVTVLGCVVACLFLCLICLYFLL